MILVENQIWIAQRDVETLFKWSPSGCYYYYRALDPRHRLKRTVVDESNVVLMTFVSMEGIKELAQHSKATEQEKEDAINFINTSVAQMHANPDAFEHTRWIRDNELVCFDSDKLKEKILQQKKNLSEVSRALNRSRDYVRDCIAKGTMGKSSFYEMCGKLGIAPDELRLEQSAKEFVRTTGENEAHTANPSGKMITIDVDYLKDFLSKKHISLRLVSQFLGKGKNYMSMAIHRGMLNKTDFKLICEKYKIDPNKLMKENRRNVSISSSKQIETEAIQFWEDKEIKAKTFREKFFKDYPKESRCVGCPVDYGYEKSLPDLCKIQSGNVCRLCWSREV